MVKGGLMSDLGYLQEVSVTIFLNCQPCIWLQGSDIELLHAVLIFNRNSVGKQCHELDFHKLNES